MDESSNRYLYKVVITAIVVKNKNFLIIDGIYDELAMVERKLKGEGTEGECFEK